MALTDNILAYWNLNDNGSGGVSLVDSTGNGSTLTNEGTTLASGIIAGCADCLSGFLYSNPVNLSSDFSNTFWVKFNASVPSGTAILGAGSISGYQLNVDASSNTFSVLPANLGSSLDYTYTFSPDQWYFVSVVRNSGNISVFINGISIGTNFFAGDLTCRDSFQIGGYTGFNGELDEFGFWSRALSSQEVSDLYYGGLGNTYPFTNPLPVPLTAGCEAYWNLNDNGSGGVSLVDSTPNGYTLTIDGTAPTLGTGIIAGDSVFDNTNYGNLLNNSIDLSNLTSVSVSAWFNTSGNNYDWHAIGNWYPVGAGNAQILFYFINGYGYFTINSGDVYIQSIATVNDGNWHNFVGTYDGSTASFYIDGILQDSTSYSTALVSSTGWGIGNATFSDTGNTYNGSIDEVGVWRRALSQADVTALYNGGAGLTYPFTNALYYNNAENDGDWGNLLNWWRDSGFTTQATALPNNNNPVNLYNEVTQNTQGANQCFCSSASFWSANFGAGLTLQSTGVVNMQGSSVMAGNTTDGVSMHDSSQLTATSVVDGNVVMRDSSRAFGSILGNATIYYDGGNGQFPIGGTVGGSVTYIGWPAISPQWFNDQATGGADDGDFANMANWWSDDTYTTRPINSVGYQQLPDASTNVFIAPDTGIYANTGDAILVNSITANNGYISNITLTVSNGIVFSGNGNYGTTNAIIYADVTFSGTAYNDGSAIHGNADYKSSISLVESFNHNSLGNLTLGASRGSNSMTVTIADGTSLVTNWISRLLHLPWFINV
jgi:hypothetical protein